MQKHLLAAAVQHLHLSTRSNAQDDVLWLLCQQLEMCDLPADTCALIWAQPACCTISEAGRLWPSPLPHHLWQGLALGLAGSDAAEET